MADITRTVTSGAVADGEQLQHELSENGTGTYCEGVSIASGSPNDTITMTFIGTPDGAEVDDVISAHPSYAAGLATEVSLAADTWTTIYTRPLAATGRWLEVEAVLALRIGSPASMQVCIIHVDGCGVRQRDAATCTVDGPTATPYGDNFGAAARFVADGTRMLLQIKTTDAQTVYIDGQVLEPRGSVFLD